MSLPGDQVSGIKTEIAALKRERVIEAAVELFYERGYDNTTLDAVAERLGVTKPFIYSQFASKAELLAEICSRAINSSQAVLDSVLTMRVSPAEKLALFSRRFVVAVIDSQKHMAIFTREEKNLDEADFRRISERRRDFDQKLTKLLKDGAKSGDFSISDAQLTSLAIGGMVSWVYVWYRPHGRLSLSNLADRMTELILSMVGAKPPA